LEDIWFSNPQPEIRIPDSRDPLATARRTVRL
jgi:hypothetical protein